METIVVKESVKGKFGPQLKDEKGYLSFGKFYKGDTEFSAGTVLEADLYITQKGARYINSVNVVKPTEAKKEVVEEKAVEKPVEKVAKKAAKAVAFGRDLSDYELQKDRRIGIAGVVQAIVGSEWYAQQAALTDLSNKDSVQALRDFAKEEAEYWLSVIQEKSI